MLNAFVAWTQKHWPIAAMFMGVDYLVTNILAGPVINTVPDPQMARAVITGADSYFKFAIVNTYDYTM